MARAKAIVSLVLLSVWLALPVESADIKVTPTAYLSFLTAVQAREFFDFHVNAGTPGDPLANAANAVVVTAKSHGTLTITISEDDPGEIPAPITVVVLDDVATPPIATASIETIKGDGSFGGGSQVSGTLSYGSVHVFPGQQSVTQAMKLHVTLSF